MWIESLKFGDTRGKSEVHVWLDDAAPIVERRTKNDEAPFAL